MVGGKNNKLKFEFCCVATFGRVVQRKKRQRSVSNRDEAGECNGPGSQATSELSRATSSPRVPTGWGLESGVGSDGQEGGQEPVDNPAWKSVGGVEAGRCPWEQGTLWGTTS